MKRRGGLGAIACGVALVAVSVGVWSSGIVPANAKPASFTTTFSVPGHAEVNVTEDSWCDNTGPHITLSSTVNIGGYSLLMTFQNNVKGTHKYQTVGVATLELVNATDPSLPPQIWKQPPLGGVGGNPFIYYQDPNGANYYIGRCVQDGKIGQFNHGRWSSDFSVGAFSNGSVTALGCSNKGSSLNVSANSGTGGVTGHLVFSNSDLGLNPQHINDTDVLANFAFSLADGQSVPKSGHLGGPGGNPLVGTDFGTGADVNSFSVFSNTHADHGRCNKLY
jgi:hypothetical protein